MRKTTTPNMALRLQGGWPSRLGNGSSRWFTPLGLILMLFALFVPNIASADIVTTTYDFTTKSWDKTITYSTTSERNCTYFTKIGQVQNPERFAAQNPEKWVFERTSGSGVTSNTAGLCNNFGSGRRFLVSNLYVGDKVTFDVVALNNTQSDVTIANESSGANKNGNTFTMTEKGSLVVWIPNLNSIKYITVEHDNSASWNYDPAIEIYDLSGLNSGAVTVGESAGYKFYNGSGGYEAKLLGNPNGYSLNQRIVVMNGDFSWANGLKNTKTNASRLVGINNLLEGDRVVITYSGNAVFSSHHTDFTINFAAAGNVFKDVNNNGDLDDDETLIEGPGETVESGAVYTMLADGHLDIALGASAIITKIEIYADHQARMVDKKNGPGSNTSYFDTTGQLEAKHHIVPGGLNVYIGSDNKAEHAEIVVSDEGYVSYVYDQDRFKFARQSGFSINAAAAAPVTGTFYRFEPEVAGKMTVRLKGYTVKYDNYWNGAKGTDTGNEHQTNNEACRYYVMVKDANGNYTQYAMQSRWNGATIKFENVPVTPGNTYYVFGWWTETTTTENWNTKECGIAQLIDVTFIPDSYVEPLAKWVDSNTPDVNEAADVQGYTDVCIKKMSDNIESCDVSISNGKLNINNITYKEGTNPGGVILVKVGNRWNDADPVFVLTIAYDAAFNEQVVGTDANGNEGKRTDGYTWNFSDNSLSGLKWTNRDSQEATVTDFGTRFNDFATADKDDDGVPTNGVNQNSFLTEEINHGDWDFNYRVKKGTQFMDPRFLNNYDMEGDNADMMWDTQGIIIKAGSQQSCIFNEHGVSINHETKIQADPDRYIGFLKGGSFIIPKLNKDDRVIIYMGSGNGSGNQAMEFHITNALDALHNPISKSDSYWIGGSQWNGTATHKDPYYRGCYHFFAAADGDMEFEMSGGSMCKLYSIQIYRGERIETNAVQGDNGYTLLAVKDQNDNVTSTETKSWNLHHRGKGEEVAQGKGEKAIVNEVIASSGNIENTTLGIVRGGEHNSAIGVSYTNQGEIGMLRVRVKCMEYNNNYVTDYADRNLTLALHETKSYPYTWDFTDINQYSGSDITAENTSYPETTKEWDTKGYDLSMWDENGGMILSGPTWGYQNQNMIFENSKGINGNQLYANGKVIPETKGLWWYFDNNDAAYSGSMQITSEGLKLANTPDIVDGVGTRRGWWNYKMVVPDVPAGAAVYLRVARDENVSEENVQFKNLRGEDIDETFFYKSYQFASMSAKAVIGSDDNSKLYETEDGSGDYIMAMYNSGAAGNLTLTLNGWILKKMSISSDKKTLDSNGWATESREHVIDPALTAYLTGYDIETCFVEEIDYGKVGGEGKVLLTRANLNDASDGQIIRAAADGDAGACILHNTAGAPVEILDGGFHLFVPDMHDFEDTNFKNNDATGIKTITTTSNGILKAQVTPGTIPAKEGDYTNYILSNKKYAHDGDTVEESVEAFYRVSPTKPARSGGHNAYLQMETGKVTGSQANTFEVVFELDKDVDGINEVNDTKTVTTEGVYTIDGQKLNGMPTNSGLYIVNGKKVVIK